MAVFTAWAAMIMLGCAVTSWVFFIWAPEAKTSLRSVIGVLTGMTAVYLFLILTIMGLNWLIETVVMAMGFGG